MAVIALTSAKGAPGVTTTAVGLTLLWPRPAVLVEADVAGGSSVLAGYLRGGADHSRGLVGLGLAHRQAPLTVADVWAQTVQLAPDKHLVPTVADHAQAYPLTTTWGPLGEVLASLERAGIDVIVDAGRLGTAHGPQPLLRSADQVLLVTGSRLPDVHATRTRVQGLADDLTTAGSGSDALHVLVVGEGRPYNAAEIAKALGAPATTLAWDPVTAEVFSVGATAARRFDASPLARSMHALVSRLGDQITRRRDRLAPIGASPASHALGGRP